MILKFLAIFLNLFTLVLIPNEEILFAQQFSDQGFADYLFNQGEYYRAITEYYRLLYTDTDSTQKIIILKHIGLCYFYGADYEGYVSFIDKHRTYFQSHTFILNEMDLYLGKCYYQLNRYPKAITVLEWTNIDSNNPFFDENQFLLGISYARIFDWPAAVKKMQLIIPESPRKQIAENFIHSSEDFSNLPQRSPLVAGTLSALIPGTGYLYCNQKGTGLTSFIINGLLIWTIRDALTKKQYGLASAAGFFEIGWYIGNIKGSINAANTYNSNIRNKFIDDLLKAENDQEYLKP